MTKEESWKDAVVTLVAANPLNIAEAVKKVHDAAYQNGLDHGRIEVLEASEARNCTPPAPAFDVLWGR